MKIINSEFPISQYQVQEYDKKQIVLHHTVSGLGVDGDLAWWAQTVGRVATCFIICRTGKIYQNFKSVNQWGHHLGISVRQLADMGISDFRTRNLILDRESIGIELDSWGPVLPLNNKFYAVSWDSEHKMYVPNSKYRSVDPKNVTKLETPFRGFIYFESYTKEQVESLNGLLISLGKEHNIPLTYNEINWDVNIEAIKSQPGLFYHCSYRPDKSDIYPDQKLIEMLQTL